MAVGSACRNIADNTRRSAIARRSATGDDGVSLTSAMSIPSGGGGSSPAGTSLCLEVAPAFIGSAPSSAVSSAACVAMSTRRHVELHDCAESAVAPPPPLEGSAPVRGMSATHSQASSRTAVLASRKYTARTKAVSRASARGRSAAGWPTSAALMNSSAAVDPSPSSSSHWRIDGSAFWTTVAASLRTPGTSIMAPARRRISDMARAAATAATVASELLSGLTIPWSRSPHRPKDVTNRLGAQSRAHRPRSVAAVALDARSPPAPLASHARSTCVTNRSSASDPAATASRSARDAASSAAAESAVSKRCASMAASAASAAAGSASRAAVSWPGRARRMRTLAARLFTCADASIVARLAVLALGRRMSYFTERPECAARAKPARLIKLSDRPFQSDGRGRRVRRDRGSAPCRPRPSRSAPRAGGA